MELYIANFAITKSVPSMLLPTNLNVGGTFLLFAGFSALMWVCITFSVEYELCIQYRSKTLLCMTTV